MHRKRESQPGRLCHANHGLEGCAARVLPSLAMSAQKTRLVVRVVSCDAKVIGTLVGGCRVTVRHRDTGEVLARGVQQGGSGDTEAIMKQPHPRFGTVFGTEGSACYTAELELAEPTPVEVTAEGPLAFPDAAQTASKTTWLIPGEHLEGEGLTLTLHGFIVDLMSPGSAEVFHSGDPLHLEACVKLL